MLKENASNSALTFYLLFGYYLSLISNLYFIINLQVKIYLCGILFDSSQCKDYSYQLFIIFNNIQLIILKIK